MIGPVEIQATPPRVKSTFSHCFNLSLKDKKELYDKLPQPQSESFVAAIQPGRIM